MAKKRKVYVVILFVNNTEYNALGPFKSKTSAMFAVDKWYNKHGNPKNITYEIRKYSWEGELVQYLRKR